MPPNHFLSVAVDYLFRQRTGWRADAAVGKTVVSSAMIDRVTARLGRRLYEVPVGFKWYVDGLLGGSLGFGGEESAGASFNRFDGRAWSTDKDGIAAALLSAEITARDGRDPGQAYRELTHELGQPFASRIDAAATPPQKKTLKALDRSQIRSTEIAGDAIEQVLTEAPGNGAAIGGVKVISRNGWFAARPSGTEDIYKIYAESFRDEAHLARLLSDAQTVVDAALGAT
jgi:phosphoglucomutase